MKRSSAMKWLLTALPVIALTLPQAALAGGKGQRHYSNHGVSHSARHHGHRDFNRRHYRHRNYHRYDHGYRHRYRPHRHSRHRHRSHRSHRGAYLVGGLIAGSLITHALTRPQERYYRNEYRSTRVVTPRFNRARYSTPADSSVSRRLFRDRDGNCFERTISDGGEELLIELPARECAW